MVAGAGSSPVRVMPAIAPAGGGVSVLLVEKLSFPGGFTPVGDASSPCRLDRPHASEDDPPILVLHAEVSFTSTSSHVHTPNSGGVLRRDLEPAWQKWPHFRLALTS